MHSRFSSLITSDSERNWRKYNEEVLAGYDWFGCIGHGCSCIGGRPPRPSCAAAPIWGSHLRLERLLHRRQRRVRDETKARGRHTASVTRAPPRVEVCKDETRSGAAVR